MHKRLKVLNATHEEIKKEAKAQGMFIDDFLNYLLKLNDHQKQIKEMKKWK